MRGVYLIWRKTTLNFQNGYIPFDWSSRDISDAKLALRYLGDLCDWHEWFTKKRKEEQDAAAEKEELS
jgi:hypothetical protein